jgi:hypothetical protein
MVPDFKFPEMCHPVETLGGIWSFTEGLLEFVGVDGHECRVAKMCEALQGGGRTVDAIDRVVNAAVNFAAEKVFEDDLCVLGIDFRHRA